MDRQEYARRADALKQRLWRTALCYLNDEQAALELLRLELDEQSGEEG